MTDEPSPIMDDDNHNKRERPDEDEKDNNAEDDPYVTAPPEKIAKVDAAEAETVTTTTTDNADDDPPPKSNGQQQQHNSSGPDPVAPPTSQSDVAEQDTAAAAAVVAATDDPSAEATNDPPPPTFTTAGNTSEGENPVSVENNKDPTQGETPSMNANASATSADPPTTTTTTTEATEATVPPPPQEEDPLPIVIDRTGENPAPPAPASSSSSNPGPQPAAAPGGPDHPPASTNPAPAPALLPHPTPLDPSATPTVVNPDQIVEERGTVSALYVGKVIGKGGEMIRDLQARSGARMDVDQNVPPGQPRVITYRGTRQTVDYAKMLVQMLSQEGVNESDLPLGQARQEILIIPSQTVGKVIGRGGEMIRELQSRSHAKIQVDHSSGSGVGGIPPDKKQVTIVGTEAAVVKAKEMVLFLVANPMMDALQALNLLTEEKVRGSSPWGSGPPCCWNSWNCTEWTLTISPRAFPSA